MAANLPGIQAGQMTLDGPTIANTYLGKITKWNDPAIAQAIRAFLFARAIAATLQRMRRQVRSSVFGPFWPRDTSMICIRSTSNS